MTGLSVEIALGTDERGRDELVRIARRADDVGVPAVWFTEGVGRDVFTVLTEVALATTRVRLGTGIVNVFARTPTMIAQSTASVLEVMGGRDFDLGLGTSGRGLVEKAYGVGFDRPVTRLSETIRIVDAAFRDHRTPGPLSVLQPREFPFGVAADRGRLRIHAAGLGPASLRVTGRYADGWLPIWPSLVGFAALRAEVDRAAASAGRPRLEVAAYVYGVVGDDEHHRRAVRDTLAWYIAGNGSAYRHLFERYGYGEEVRRITELWDDGRRPEAREAVPDDLLDDTALLGAPREFLARADRFTAAGVDRVVWRVPRHVGTDEVLAMLDRLAPVAAP